jgi:hypothetical protein
VIESRLSRSGSAADALGDSVEIATRARARSVKKLVDYTIGALSNASTAASIECIVGCPMVGTEMIREICDNDVRVWLGASSRESV